MLNAGKPPVDDRDARSFMAEQSLDLQATTDLDSALEGAELVIIAAPTNYDPDSNFFDTSSVESVIARCTLHNPSAVLVVKSTVPVGFCERVLSKFPEAKLVFSPEFLREGTALADNLSPSRVVVGGADEHIDVYLAANAPCLRNDPPVLTMAHTEAEAVKLSANTYLAMRVAFFNELDSYALHHGLDTRKIIVGVSLDPRVGAGYNNPSFGYGGYCLPKDSKQLLSNYFNVPNNLIKAIVEANDTRKNFIVENIINRQPKSVGIYRLVMKAGSDNYRESSISSIVRRLLVRGIEVVVFDARHFSRGARGH